MDDFFGGLQVLANPLVWQVPGPCRCLSWCALPEIVEDPLPVAPVLLIEDFASSPIISAEIARQSAKDKTLAQVLS